MRSTYCLDDIIEPLRYICTVRGACFTAIHIEASEVEQVLADFNNMWASMQPAEQARAIELLIERVTFDGRVGNLSITYRPTGIKTLGMQLAAKKTEDAE